MPETLLVVDDNKMNRDMLSRRLAREGYATLTAESGREALELVRSHTVDLVLMDLMMPEMNGIEVLQELRKTRPANDLPVIMVSANTDSPQMEQALTQGANDYVVKPIDFPVTLARIKGHLARRMVGVPAAAAPAPAAPPAPPPAQSINPDDLKVGDSLAHFKLEALLGEGGMGKVFRGKDTRLLRDVAIKVLLGEGMTQTQIDRFLQEARAVARVSHPGVITIFEIGEQPTNFIAMELVEGSELEALLESGKAVELPRATDLTIQILDALQAVHSKGILHRDLKPSNIMLDAHGRVRVMDFGLAKIVEEDLKLTKSGEVWGTPQYMAPEHVDPGFGDIDEQTDVFATGTIFYQMLTGSLPIRAKTLPQILFEVVSKAPDPPHKLNPQVSLEVSAACMRSLEKRKDRRYKTAGEFASALRAL